jgi:hypothetical protein
MAREYDRPATITALVNAAVVYLLPLAFAWVVSLLPDNRIGTTVTARGPDYLWHRAQHVAAYVAALSPFAMAAAWRTFVHARRWLQFRDRTWLGVLEGGACGLAGTLIVMLPGILRNPLLAWLFVLLYGLYTVPIGLAIGFILRFTALGTLKLMVMRPATIPR